MTIDNIDPSTLIKVKSNYIFSFNCKNCNDQFGIRAVMLRSMIKGTTVKQYCCSRKCAAISRRTLNQRECPNCLTLFDSSTHYQKFCSQSCAATFNNQRKSHGIRRSKLEQWIEDQLTTAYPNIEIQFNKKSAIGSELDIYIPSLQLAVELNGIFHYKPIFTEDQLIRCKANDDRKVKACIDNQIHLHVINTSSQKIFKPENSESFLREIKDLIESNLGK